MARRVERQGIHTLGVSTRAKIPVHWSEEGDSIHMGLTIEIQTVRDRDTVTNEYKECLDKSPGRRMPYEADLMSCVSVRFK